ncbi:hypothetical protein GHT06_020356 [Daphnia sinensis]|uniref:Uncharacterized protein n=1 Tax=Daphnia sinensis TaxID=1820382 RepID=A0AAD5L2Y7_9CRUS|nr:hypothetical protein GHT06_020356 [Daphnia sinensis]
MFSWPWFPYDYVLDARFLDVFALHNTGSQATLLREEAAQARFGCFGTFHGKDAVVDTRLVDFPVSSLVGGHDCQVSDAFGVPHLNVGQRKMTDVIASFEYLRGLIFPARNATKVQDLIGMDVQDAHLNQEVSRPPIGVRGLNAVLTPFGWCGVGRTFSSPAAQTPSVNFV